MRAIRTGALILALLTAGGLAAARAAAAEPAQPEPPRAEPAEDQTVVIERRIEEARKELDEAARKLGRLHSQMWRLETAGPRAQRPMLGILIHDSGANRGGIDLVGVSPGGGAEQAGLQAGDKLVMINGVRLDTRGESKPLHLFSQAMSSVKAGDPVPVEYVRDGKTLRTEVVTEKRGSFMARVVDEKSEWLEGLQALEQLENLQALEGLEQLEVLKDVDLQLGGNVTRIPAGLRLENVEGELAGYFDVERGVLVLGTPKREQTLQAGDILLELGGTPVDDADAVLARLGTLQGQVAGKVKRRGQVSELTLDADALNAEQALQVTGGDRRIRIQRHDAADEVQMEIIVDD